MLRAIARPPRATRAPNSRSRGCGLAQQRPAEAVAALQPALRGNLEGWSYYATRTELHEALAQAWDAAARARPDAAARDSAAAHYRAVAEGWRRGDPPFAARAVAARARAVALGG
jgi:hypothetical protein